MNWKVCLVVLALTGFALALAGTALAQEPLDWDRSSLAFDPEYGCQATYCLVKTRVCNVGDGLMLGPSTWELWYSAQGNPREGEKVAEGIIIPLLPGMCQPLAWVALSEGNYKFRAFQRPGHPGEGDTWSEECVVDCPPTAVTLSSLRAVVNPQANALGVLGVLVAGALTFTTWRLRR